MNNIDLLKQLVKIQSVTDSESESMPLEMIGRILHENNIHYKIIGSDSKKNLVAEIGHGKKSILLNSHFDVVPADKRMLIPKIKNGYLYGRGVADAKGPLVAMLDAFIKLSKQKLPGKIIFCAVCDEENAGNKGTKILVEKSVVADYVIAGEPTDNNIIIAEKGFLRLNILVKGKELHAAFPNKNMNAIFLASQIIQNLEQFDVKVSHPILGKPTISFGLIQGGKKINIGAGECNIGIDIRYLPIQSEKEIIQQIQNMLKPIAEIEISIIDSGIPFETSPESKLVQIAKAVTKGKLQGVNFGTDARYYKDAECIVLGPGKSEIAHQKEEFVAIKDLEKAVQYYERIVRRCLEE